ncbi:MAG: hypothetical protein CFE44_20415 [Burkholderiales bacterium PBB4]|nr:MAG: hypothetical protein CFE44_20415 [Burkholderiales bacterium PBB4]
MALAARDGIFREPFPENPQKPPKLLLEKVWGKDIEASSIAEVEREKDVLLGTVNASREQWPLSITVDYVGLELRKSDIPAERQGYFYLRLECPQEPYGRCGEDADTYSRHKRGLETSGSFSRKSIKIDGTSRDVHVMDGMLLRYKVNLGAQVNIYMSRALAPKTLETHRLRLRVFGGEVSYTPPARELAKISSPGKQVILVVLIVAGLIWLVRLIRPSETAPESPPRLLGVLVCVLGSALVFASYPDTLLFYPVTGLLIAISGMFLSIGSRLGLWAYGLMLAVAWGITFNDYGAALGKDAVMRVGMITLLALYVFSSRVSERLGTEE